jgi:hypothetical protein
MRAWVFEKVEPLARLPKHSPLPALPVGRVRQEQARRPANIAFQTMLSGEKQQVFGPHSGCTSFDSNQEALS